MGLRFSSKTIVISFTSVLTFVFATALLLPTICVAGKGKDKKKPPPYLSRMDKVEVCHINGTYDLGEGDVPVGHVIKIAESALPAHLKHGDPGYFEVVELPDGTEVCYEPVVVCHITGSYYFGEEEGDVPIGEVMKIHADYYKIHIEHGDPETYRVVTLPDGSEEEVCRELLEGESQFEKGMALFGHDYDDGVMLTRKLTPKMSQVLNKTKRGAHYKPITSFYIDGKQYIMGIRSYKNDDGKYPYFIQQILPSGDFGPQPATGAYYFYYKTLIAMTLADGKVFIFGQEDGNNNHAMTQEILPGGRLGSQPWHDNWDTFYDTVTPIPFNNGRTCFFAHNSGNKKWKIYCIHQPGMGTEGSVYIQDHGGQSRVGYQEALSYHEGGRTFLLRHRHHLEGVHERGPRDINEIDDHNRLGGATDDKGEWDKYYQTLTTFFWEGVGDHFQYIFGHNSDKDWFIQHVSSKGIIYEVIDSGKWDVNYEYACPVAFDEDTYWWVDRWMGRLLAEIPDFGERKLTEIALPGSHDSGMNPNDVGGCYYGNACNTVTQNFDMQGQLALGARYFDIRPKLASDDIGVENWRTGHVQHVALSSDGCLGEDKLSIIDALKDFFANHGHPKELVILHVSHCMEPPQVIGNDLCTDRQLYYMSLDFADRLDDHLVKCDDCNLKEMTLNEILEHGNILLVFDNVYGSKSKGIFKWGTDYFNHDEYSNTNKFDDMASDQINKLLDYEYDWPFLLSWTLTLSKGQASECLNPFDPSPTKILDLAFITEPRIFEYMYKEFEAGNLTKKYFPNILYVDDFGRTATSAAIFLNRNWDSLVDDR